MRKTFNIRILRMPLLIYILLLTFSVNHPMQNMENVFMYMHIMGYVQSYILVIVSEIVISSQEDITWFSNIIAMKAHNDAIG